MTLNLTVREKAAFEELAAKKALSTTATMRLALRLLQAVDAKVGSNGPKTLRRG